MKYIITLLYKVKYMETIDNHQKKGDCKVTRTADAHQSLLSAPETPQLSSHDPYLHLHHQKMLNVGVITRKGNPYKTNKKLFLQKD